jgi:thermostable 8-oxoguanine DNA glycosylase
MIDPTKITHFARTQHELEEFWLFCIAVAGKTASQIAAKIDQFLSGKTASEGPYDYVRRLITEDRLRPELERVKMGKYRLLVQGYAECVADSGPDLSTATPRDLEAIYGVKHKTARFFILHSRENADVAVIDTHVLKYLKHRGHDNIPDSVPQTARYYEIEELMKSEARLSALSFADFDLAVWNHYSSKGASPLPLLAA